MNDANGASLHRSWWEFLDKSTVMTHQLYWTSLLYLNQARWEISVVHQQLLTVSTERYESLERTSDEYAG